MIPNNETQITGFDVSTLPTKTWALHTGSNSIVGYTDDIEAMVQMIYLMLNTERYDWLIYSWNYGVELNSLYGKPLSYVAPELKRRINEALFQDERIIGVDNYSFESSANNKLLVTFTVHTVFGEIDAKKEVMI